MKAMDFLQMENFQACRDTVALLAVMLEQAVLDGGRLDLAQILTLSDDPPVTTSLAFIKELDTITTKRLELVSTSQSSTSGGSGGDQDGGRGRGDAKGRGKGRKQQQQQEEEA